MQYRTLGRTNLQAPVLGFGTGGLDPLGLKSDRTESEMIDLLHFVFDQGITLFDTSPSYGDGRSEEILGKALKTLPRDQVVVSTKVPLIGPDRDGVASLLPAAEVADYVESSLRRLQLDAVDIMFVAVTDNPELYEQVVAELFPVVQKFQEQGKIRFLGSSEKTLTDGDHDWLRHILPTDILDVILAGCNLINQSAATTVYPLCRELNVGALNVFTVRRAIGDPARLEEVVLALKQQGLIAADEIPDERPLDWLIGDSVDSVIEAAYRFAAYTEGVTTVLCGTILEAELEQNIRSIAKGPLPAEKLERLRHVFGRVAVPVGN